MNIDIIIAKLAQTKQQNLDLPILPIKATQLTRLPALHMSSLLISILITEDEWIACVHYTSPRASDVTEGVDGVVNHGTPPKIGRASGRERV